MSPATLFIVLLGLSSAAYYVGRRRAYAVAGDAADIKQLHRELENLNRAQKGRFRAQKRRKK